MKKIFVFSVVLMNFVVLCANDKRTTVHYDDSGIVKAVEFSEVDDSIPVLHSAMEFFESILDLSEKTTFKERHLSKLNKGNETYQQYYNGIKVEDGVYSFHFTDTGYIFYAHGHYVKIDNLLTEPEISEKEACEIFAKHQNISNVDGYVTELVIKEIPSLVSSSKIPELTYKIYINSPDANNSKIGYVSAHTGSVILLESSISCANATGQAETMYYGWKNFISNSANNGYILLDTSRGATITTKDMHGLDHHQTASANVITDNDNVWYQSELPNRLSMALDVHWVLQKIYDRLYNAYGKNSFDNNGKAIEAYVRSMIDTVAANACWDNASKRLHFGDGGPLFAPYSSVDIVAHEYGHGIASYNIGWSGSQTYLDEGLSDIWGAILEYRIIGNTPNVWDIGEKIINASSWSLLTSIRNLKDTQNPGASMKTASTYMSDEYIAEGNDDVQLVNYIRGGVFSHWFYLLVNGGIGYNTLNRLYSVESVGMDAAEQLIVKAVYDGYLIGTASYADVRLGLINAAQALGNSNLALQVSNAWYAVGVGNTGAYPSIEGEMVPCGTSVYSVNNLLDSYTVTWSLPGASGLLAQNTPGENQCTITNNLSTTFDTDLIAYIQNAGVTVATLTKHVQSRVTGTFMQVGNTYSGNTYPDIQETGFGNGSVICINPTCLVTLNSPYFSNMTFTKTGATPNLWSNSFAGLNVRYPYSSSIQRTNVYGTDGCRSISFSIWVYPEDAPIVIEAVGTGNGYEFMLVSQSNGDGIQRNEEQLAGWYIDIRHAATGYIVYEAKVDGRKLFVNTAEWKSGIYVVRAIKDGQEAVCKIIVK